MANHRPLLRVGYIRNFPAVSNRCRHFPTLRVSNRCPYPGAMVEILNLIAEELNMTIYPVPVGNDQDKTMRYDDLTDGFEMVQHSQVDTLALGLQLTEDRVQNFSHTVSLYKVQSRLMMRRQENIYDEFWGFFDTYDTKTWITILCALFIQCTVSVVIRKAEVQMYNAKPVSVLESVWQMLRLQLMQPEKVYFNSTSGKLSIIFFSLVQCAVLLGVFSSWILSSILRANTAQPRVESLEHLINKIARGESYMVTTNPNSWFYERVNRSFAYPYAEFRRAIERNPLRVSNGIRETLGRASRGRGVVFLQDDDEALYRATGYCDLMDYHDQLPIVSAHLFLRKDSKLTPKFDRVILQNQIQVTRIHRKYWEVRKQMRASCPDYTRPQALGVIPYAGLCAVCAVFLAIGGAVLLLEIIHRRYERKRAAAYLDRTFHRMQSLDSPGGTIESELSDLPDERPSGRRFGAVIIQMDSIDSG